jgi:hypothetical protein
LIKRAVPCQRSPEILSNAHWICHEQSWEFPVTWLKIFSHKNLENWWSKSYDYKNVISYTSSFCTCRRNPFSPNTLSYLHKSHYVWAWISMVTVVLLKSMVHGFYRLF